VSTISIVDFAAVEIELEHADPDRCRTECGSLGHQAMSPE